MASTYRNVDPGAGPVARMLMVTLALTGLVLACHHLRLGGSPWPPIAATAFALGVLVGRDWETLRPSLRIWQQTVRARRASRLNRSVVRQLG